MRRRPPAAERARPSWSGWRREKGARLYFATVAPRAMAAPPCAFSPRGCRLFASAGADGRLRVWDTAGSRLQHEYVPSAHLSAACTCLAWAPAGARQPPSKVREGRERGGGGSGHA